jgi:5-formyltetrahydrofolate cyclo-ligase
VESKAELRARLRAARDALDVEVRAAAARSCVRSVLACCDGAESVLLYVAFGSELDVAPIAEALRSRGVAVLLPRVEHPRLVAVRHRPGEVLIASRFGVPEPGGPAEDAESLDAVVVPGLAFDRSCHRIGYGAGYYDRFLPTLRPDARTVGVTYAFACLDELPHEPHDVAVSTVVNERGRFAGGVPGAG